MFGIKNIKVWMTQNIDELNDFLSNHNCDILDIQCTDKYFHVIYQCLEVEQ